MQYVVLVHWGRQVCPCISACTVRLARAYDGAQHSRVHNTVGCEPNRLYLRHTDPPYNFQLRTSVD
jgi:hypothetical protein